MKRSIAYSLGALGSAITFNTLSTYGLFFYVDRLKLLPELAGWGLFTYGLWNAINDPLAGQISDRTRSRWGRRLPYLRFLTWPMAAAFILVWTPPVGADRMWGLLAYLIGAFFLFDGLYTFVILNWTALFPEMFPTLEERARVSSYRQLFGILGLLTGVALTPTLAGVLGWPVTAATYALVAGAALTISARGAFERPELAQAQGLGFREALRATFTSRNFIAYVVASLLIQLTFGMLQAAMAFYTKYALGAGEGGTTIVLGIVFVLAVPGILLWRRITVRIGAWRTMRAATIAFAAALVPYFFAPSLLVAAFGSVLVGLALGGLMILFDVLLADVIDEDELRTGVRREGMYFGINGFLIRMGGITLQAPLTAAVLAVTGYDANLAVQPALAVSGMRWLVSIVPIAFLLAGWAVLGRYGLHGKRLEELRARLQELHGAKAE